VYKIAIAGASTLVGKELKDAISESPLAAATFVLLDEDNALGQLDQVGDEITFVQPIGSDSFEHADFTFFCGSEALTHKHWRVALQAGSTVIDLSGALDQEPGVLVRSPWMGVKSGTPDLFTHAVVPAHPATIALGLLMAHARGRPLAFCGGNPACPSQRTGPRCHGRTAPADGESAQLSAFATGHL
jgi:aspartate-semialdehyde dehydrogenase